MKQPEPIGGYKGTDLIKHIREIIVSARSLAARSIDTAQVAMNFAIGQWIVDRVRTGRGRRADRLWPQGTGQFVGASALLNLADSVSQI